ncbi:MAG: glycoside hydrolase family 28 protein [Butyricicoccaceae bacterium]
MNHNKYSFVRRALCGTLAVSMLFGCAPASDPSTDAEQQESNSAAAQAELTYTVAEGMRFEDILSYSSSTEAWDYADQIVSHVEDAVAEMKEIFAKKSVSILDYGAEAHEVFDIVEGTYKKSDSDAAAEAELAKKNTKAIYAAIQDVSNAGGGTVIVPAADGAVFYTSAIHLEDNVNLHIEKDAVLKFTTDTSLYEGELMKEVYGDDVDDLGLTLTRFESVELMNYSPFIYAYGKKNIAVTGEGTLDGQASTGDEEHPETMVWHQWKSERTYADGTTIEAQNNPRTKLFGQGQTNVPVAERQYGESESEDQSGADDGFLRPNFLQPYNCQNVLIEGVNICNSPMWEINPVLCDTVLVEGVNVDSHLHNNDGCDPECTSNMVIRDNTFDVGDDCMAIKSGRNGDGLRINRPSYNIVLQDNTFVDGHGGVTIGSEITAGVKNVFSCNNEMDSDQLQAAYRFKTNYIRGGNIENIYYKDDTVKMVEPEKPVILVDLNYDVDKEVQMMEAMNISYPACIPSFKHVLFEGMNVNEAGIVGKGGQSALQLNGFSADSIASSCTVPEGTSDCYITDFTIRNSSFNGSTQAFNMNYVDGLTLENVKITGSSAADSVQNSKNLTFIGCDFTGSAIRKAVFADLDNIVLTDCLFDDAQ